MMAKALRSGWSGGSPGARLGLALAASLALHAGLLLPWPFPALQAKPEASRRLSVSLPEPAEALALTTQAEPAEPEPPLPATVSPAPTLGGTRPAPPPQEPPKEPPKELRGRALNTALAALTREPFYPRAAIEQGLEGRVVLLLALDAGGGVTGIEVASSSGHGILDQAARQAAVRIGRLPGGRRQVLLPVEFRLE